MFQKIAKPGILIVAVLGVFLLAAISLFALIGLKVYQRFQPTPVPTGVPIPFSYCGAQLQELCVVSFGREADGKTIINLYVPNDLYPEFYLKLQRTTGESIYSCEENKEVETSVYCTGEALNLQERFTVQLFSKEGDTLLAEGKFVLTAILIAAPTTQPFTPPAGTSTSSTVTKKSSATSTSSFESTEEDTDVTPEATQTSESDSYPSYP